MSNRSICAWCEPGKPGNHTICERHAAELRAEAERWRKQMRGELRLMRELRWWERAQRAGKRWDQLRFSLLVLAGLALLGTLCGAAVAVQVAWRALR